MDQGGSCIMGYGTRNSTQLAKLIPEPLTTTLEIWNFQLRVIAAGTV